MIRTLSKILWRITNRGPKETWLWLSSHYSTWSREISRRIDTRGKLPANAEAVASCNGYEPIMYECLDAIFDSLRIGSQDVLVDFGSGKGRVLIEAALQPFRRIEGIEYDLDLVKISEQNINNFNPITLNNIVFVHHCDARDFMIPRDVTHIFIWNSFEGEVLESVVFNIADLAADARQNIHVVLALPCGETESLRLFERFGKPEIIETRFWTGVDMYHFSTRSKRPERRENSATRRNGR